MSLLTLDDASCLSSYTTLHSMMTITSWQKTGKSDQMLVLLLQRCSLPVVGCPNGSSASRAEEKVWHFWTGGESLTASKHKDVNVFIE